MEEIAKMAVTEITYDRDGNVTVHPALQDAIQCVINRHVDGIGWKDS